MSFGLVVAVMVTTNEAGWLAESLGSLLASRTGRCELRIVLVDNASTDGSAELVAEQFPAVRIIRNERNLGFAGANNIGIAAALAEGADYVFLVNPDTRTPPSLIDDLTDLMHRWPEYGVVGPLQSKYERAAESELNEWSEMAVEAGEAHVFVNDWPDHPSPAGPSEGRAPRTLEHAYVQGAAFFCRAAVLRRIGSFDPTYHTFYEETDLCRRVRWAGWRVALLLDARIQHAGGGSTAASLYRRRRMQRNKFYFLLSDPDWPWPTALRLAVKWVRLDLALSGAAPAPSRTSALGDTMCGLPWIVWRVPRAVRQRRRHRKLRDEGAGGPLRAAKRQTAFFTPTTKDAR